MKSRRMYRAESEFISELLDGGNYTYAVVRSAMFMCPVRIYGIDVRDRAHGSMRMA